MNTKRLFYKPIAVFLSLLVFTLSCKTLKETKKSDPIIQEDTREYVSTKSYSAKLLDKPHVKNRRARIKIQEENKYKYQSIIEEREIYEKKVIGDEEKIGFWVIQSFGLGFHILGISHHYYNKKHHDKEKKYGKFEHTFHTVGLVIHGLGSIPLFDMNDKTEIQKKQLEGPIQYKNQTVALDDANISIVANDHKKQYQTGWNGEVEVDIHDFNMPAFLVEPKDYTFRFRYKDEPFENTLTLNSASWMHTYAVVNRNNTPLYNRSSTYGDELAKLSGGYNASVLHQSDDWHKLPYQQQKGWVDEDNLSLFYYTKDISMSDCQTDKLAQYTDYFRPKGEFEYQSEYEDRLAKGKQLQAAVVKNCLQKGKQERRQKIKESFKQITLSLDELGTYNLSAGTYPIVVNGETYRIEMDRDAAKQLKQNREEATITAAKQLKEDGEHFAVFNMQLRHPVTGKIYKFGQQRDPLYMDYTAQESGLSGLPELEVTDLSFQEPSGNNKLDANEQATIALTIKNKGDGRGQNIGAELAAPNIKGLSHQEKQYIAGLAPGKSRKLQFTLSAGKQIPEKEISLQFSFSEGNGFPPSGFNYPLQTVAFKAPEVVLYNTIIEEERSANNNGKIEKAEIVRATVEVMNNGEGTAHDVNATLHVNNPNIKLINSRKQHALGKMEPGATQFFSFTFAVNKVYEGSSELPVNVTLTTAGSKQYGGDYPLKLALQKGNPPQPPEFIPDVDKNIPRTGESKPSAVAVIIGNKDYSSAKDVRYALNDAQTMKKYLINVLGYKEANIFMEQNASKGVFQTYFGTEADYRGKLYNQIKKGQSEVFVYYSGHGAPDIDNKQGYLVPVESDPQYVSQGGYKRSLLLQNLSQLPAPKVTVVMDACFSGAVLDNISPIYIKTKPAENFTNGVVLSSSTGEQVSSWYNKKNHSMFTYFFLKALKETEQSDSNSDGKLTYQEIYQYLSDDNEGVPYHARKIHGVEQNPVIQGTAKNEVFVEYK